MTNAWVIASNGHITCDVRAPNITGTWGSSYEEASNVWTSTGAIQSAVKKDKYSENPGTSGVGYVTRTFNASLSNRLYSGLNLQTKAVRGLSVIKI